MHRVTLEHGDAERKPPKKIVDTSVECNSMSKMICLAKNT